MVKNSAPSLLHQYSDVAAIRQQLSNFHEFPRGSNVLQKQTETALFSGTGSNPHSLYLLHLNNLKQPINIPFIDPCICTASIIYCEQHGLYLQWGVFALKNIWYQRMILTKSPFMKMIASSWTTNCNANNQQNHNSYNRTEALVSIPDYHVILRFALLMPSICFTVGESGQLSFRVAARGQTRIEDIKTSLRVSREAVR